MTIRTILIYPDKRLRIKADPVPVENIKTPEVQQIIDDLIETLHAAEKGGGLAATQVHIPYRIFVIDISPKRDQPRCYINPELISKEGKTNKPEGCLSVPGGVQERVQRAKRVQLKAYDREGKLCEYVEENNYEARCFQHEIDHLDGKLFIDHLTGRARRRADMRISRWHKLRHPAQRA